jgi:transcriptional regulator with XRE-family HTH domain
MRSILFLSTTRIAKLEVIVMGNKARIARLALGYSIEEAAKKLGIPAGYLSQIELGKRQVSEERAEKISNLYGTTRDEIFLATRYAIREVSEGVEANDVAQNTG